MESHEIIEAVQNMDQSNDLVLHSHGSKLVFKNVIDGISIMSVRSKDNETIVMIPYDKIEEDGTGNITLNFDNRIRGIIDPRGVSKVWGL